MNNINYYLKFTRQNMNDNNIMIPEMVENYNDAYNNAISTFSILINTNRAEEGYLNNNINNKIKLLLDMKDSPNKTSFKPTLWRSVWVNPSVVRTGDYITLKNKHSGTEDTYIITSRVENRDGYDLCYIQYCNNSLTFKNSLGKTITFPCIISNLTLYSDGLDAKTITMLDGKRNVIVPYNDSTKDFFVQQRFIFNHNSVFSISLIDDFTVNGLLQLTMIQDTFRDTDNKELNLADNNIIPITISLPQTSYTINQGNKVVLQPVVKQADKILLLSTIYESTNPDIIRVSENGEVEGIGVGMCSVIVKLKDNEDISVVVGFEVKNTVEPPNNIVIDITSSSNWIIKKTSTTTFTGVKYVNNVVISSSFDFEILYNGLSTSAVSITDQTDQYIKIKNNIDSGMFQLKCIEKDNPSNFVIKDIQLKNIYGS